jgi:hypothetical protein
MPQLCKWKSSSLLVVDHPMMVIMAIVHSIEVYTPATDTFTLISRDRWCLPQGYTLASSLHALEGELLVMINADAQRLTTNQRLHFHTNDPSPGYMFDLSPFGTVDLITGGSSLSSTIPTATTTSVDVSILPPSSSDAGSAVSQLRWCVLPPAGVSRNIVAPSLKLHCVRVPSDCTTV